MARLRSQIRSRSDAWIRRARNLSYCVPHFGGSDATTASGAVAAAPLLSPITAGRLIAATEAGSARRVRYLVASVHCECDYRSRSRPKIAHYFTGRRHILESIEPVEVIDRQRSYGFQWGEPDIYRHAGATFIWSQAAPCDHSGANRAEEHLKRGIVFADPPVSSGLA